MTFSPHPLVLSWYSLSWWLGLIFVFPACQVSSLHWEMFRGIFIRGKKVMGEVFVSFIPSCVFVVGCESSTDWKNVSGKWNFVEIVGKTCQESEIWGKMVGKMCQENEILGKGWKNISGKWNFRGRWKNVSGKWNFGERIEMNIIICCQGRDIKRCKGEFRLLCWRFGTLTRRELWEADKD